MAQPWVYWSAKGTGIEEVKQPREHGQHQRGCDQPVQDLQPRLYRHESAEGGGARLRPEDGSLERKRQAEDEREARVLTLGGGGRERGGARCAAAAATRCTAAAAATAATAAAAATAATASRHSDLVAGLIQENNTRQRDDPREDGRQSDDGAIGEALLHEPTRVQVQADESARERARIPHARGRSLQRRCGAVAVAASVVDELGIEHQLGEGVANGTQQRDAKGATRGRDGAAHHEVARCRSG